MSAQGGQKREKSWSRATEWCLYDVFLEDEGIRTLKAEETFSCNMRKCNPSIFQFDSWM